ncbi:hypothetical protein F5Y06DRAFT_292583 [Hypoxylon sp. FL0890]|nr:hypothetical protein F5Y06DRAFT_292583 [Hypoxylon sp. FL0890]
MATPEWVGRVQNALEEARSEDTNELPKSSYPPLESDTRMSTRSSPAAAEKDYLRELFETAMQRYNVWELEEVKQHLKYAFWRAIYYVMEPLREALGLVEQPNVSYDLVGRYPPDGKTRPGISPLCKINLPSDYRDIKKVVIEQTEDDVRVLLTKIFQKIIGVFHNIDSPGQQNGVPWDNVLVLGLSFLDHDYIRYPLNVQSRSRYVFLLTGDKRHVVLHDTYAPDEAKAIATHRAVLHDGEFLAEEYHEEIDDNH